jgi:acetyl esterase/lipase
MGAASIRGQDGASSCRGFIDRDAVPTLCLSSDRVLRVSEDLSVLTRAAVPSDQVMAYGDETDQVADVWSGGPRARQRPLLLVVHGGFWRPQHGRGQAGSMAAALAAAGWTTAVPGYRRIPGVPDATVADVAQALERLPSRIEQHDGRAIVIGHSAGGHLALLVAAKYATPSLCGVLALAPAADLRIAHRELLGDGAVAAFLGARPECRADLDPQQLDKPAVPTVLLHGDVDTVVPLAVSESYLAAHQGVRLVRLAQCGHFALIDPLSAQWPVVAGELERLSGGPAIAGDNREATTRAGATNST